MIPLSARLVQRACEGPQVTLEKGHSLIRLPRVEALFFEPQTSTGLKNSFVLTRCHKGFRPRHPPFLACLICLHFKQH